MNRRRVFRWVIGIILGLVAAIVIAAVILYLLAIKVPSDYHPVTLTQKQKVQALQSLQAKVEGFIRMAGEIGSVDPNQVPGARVVMGPDGPMVVGPDGKPLPPGASSAIRKREFQMAITQTELNEYAATMSDKFASALQSLGMSSPAVAIGQDRLTFYSHWDAYDMVVGLDMALHFDENGAMTIALKSARVGELPMRDADLQKHKEEVVAKLQSHVRSIGQGTGDFAGQPVKIFNDAAGKVADALDGKPVKLDVRQGFGNVRIRGIKMEDGQATLDVVSLLPEDAPATRPGMAP